MLDNFDLWMHSHPWVKAVFVTVALGALTALANWLARTSTPDEWEKMKREHPRAAACISLLRGLGVDPAKVLKSIRTLITGQSEPPQPPTNATAAKPPPPPEPPVLLRVAASACVLLVACSPVVTREQARSALVMMAEGVKESDRVCAKIARSLPAEDWLALAERCAKSYRLASMYLEKAEARVDSMSSEPAPFWCAAGGAASVLSKVIAVIAAKSPLSAALEDIQITAKAVSAVATAWCQEEK